MSPFKDGKPTSATLLPLNLGQNGYKSDIRNYVYVSPDDMKQKRY
jgi:hypothetical protein